MRAEDWPRFKGPRGSGLSAEENLPSKIDLDADLVWKRQVPAGVSSPIIVDSRVVLTVDLGERIQATPALADGSVFVRSETALWRLGRKPD